MKKTPSVSLAVALAALAFPLLAACATAAPARRVYVRVGPPAVRVEVRGVAPSPNHVWISGHYRWDGDEYDWVLGHWEVRPRARAVWVDGHWKKGRHGWHWMPGHWK